MQYAPNINYCAIYLQHCILGVVTSDPQLQPPLPTLCNSYCGWLGGRYVGAHPLGTYVVNYQQLYQTTADS